VRDLNFSLYWVTPFSLALLRRSGYAMAKGEGGKGDEVKKKLRSLEGFIMKKGAPKSTLLIYDISRFSGTPQKELNRILTIRNLCR
jgi:hypothetical protein